MPRQESIPVAANVLGTIGTILWCIQLVPQIWRNYRSKSTEGLPALMMFIWATCKFSLGIHLIISYLLRIKKIYSRSTLRNLRNCTKPQHPYTGTSPGFCLSIPHFMGTMPLLCPWMESLDCFSTGLGDGHRIWWR